METGAAFIPFTFSYLLIFTFSLIFPSEPENIGSAIQIYIGIEPVSGRKLDLVECFGFYIPGLKIDRRN